MRVGALLLAMLAATGVIADQPLETLVTDLDRIRERNNIAAVAVTLVDRKGQVTAFASGLADRASNRSMTPDTLVRIGSITKTFNALAFLMLAEEGRVQLCSIVHQRAPRAPFVNRWAASDPVRVVHLLEHSSGLLDLTREEFDHSRPFRSLEEALEFRPEAREVQWPPGLHRVYSNLNAGLSGYVLEQVTGQRWDDLIVHRLLRPLRMRSAGTTLDEAAAGRLATGYDRDGTTAIPYWHMIFPPLGAINASPRDMAALPRLLLGRGEFDGRRLLAAGSIARMEAPQSTLAARSGLDYGYGPGLDQWLHRGFRFFGHGGDGDGYLSRFAYSRDADVGYFLVINGFNRDALNDMTIKVQDWLTAGLEPPPVPPVTVVARAELAALAGEYRSATRRFPWEPVPSQTGDRVLVELGPHGLLTKIGDEHRSLIPVTRRHFRRPGQTIATIAFVSHDGLLYLQGDFGNYRRVAGSAGAMTSAP